MTGDASNITPFSGAADMLRRAISQKAMGHADSELLKKVDGKASLLRLATTQAIHEMLWTSSVAGFDEEHHTASLMGHLATNLGWYALMRHWTPDSAGSAPASTCDLHWAHQSKSREAIYGGDFGIALREGPDQFKIALFQAKRVEAGQMVDVKRGPKKDEPKAIADEDLKALIDHESFPGAPDREKSHQLYKLAYTDWYGNEILKQYNSEKEDYPVWAHYVFWHQTAEGSESVRAPTVQPVWDVIKSIRETRRERANESISASDLKISSGGIDFIELISNGLRYEKKEYGLTVNYKEANALLGKLASLLPTMLLADETGSGGGVGPWQALVGDKMHVSPASAISASTITETPKLALNQTQAIQSKSQTYQSNPNTQFRVPKM
jgi:hypothetical protein